MNKPKHTKAETQIERVSVITYRWWRDGKEGVLPSHVPALEEKAEERIAEMIADGCTSGELTDNIHMAGDPEDGVEYSGWWEVSHPSPMLIAAAPELLAALKQAQAMLETASLYFPTSIKNSDRFALLNLMANTIKPAIEKAEGAE